MKFRLQATGEWITVNPRRLYVVGFGGRDQAAVMEHVKELEHHGIRAPNELPSLYVVPLDKLSTAGEMQVTAGTTSGEVEPVLIVAEDGTAYVAVGSDHTDREAEKAGIDISKQLCAKMVSEEIWRYADVKDQWDSLVLRSWVGPPGAQTLYQDDRAGVILPPDEVRAFVEKRVGDVRGSVIFLGTVTLLNGQFSYLPDFTAELIDAQTGRTLRCSYRVERADTPPRPLRRMNGMKEEYEFYPVAERPWEPVMGSKCTGLYQRVLAGDSDGPNHTRMLKFEPGTDTTPNGTQVHEYWEEVYILEGSIIDLRLNQEFKAGTYACRPPGMLHGPWHSPGGCITFEVRYNAPKE